MSHQPLKRFHKDAAGVTGDEVSKAAPEHSRWFHPKTGKLYRVIGIGFDSERERWVIIYKPQSSDGTDAYEAVPFFHLPEDFHREGRFLRVTS